MFVGFGVDSTLIIRTDLVRTKKIGSTPEWSASVYLPYLECNGCTIVSDYMDKRDRYRSYETFTRLYERQ